MSKSTRHDWQKQMDRLAMRLQTLLVNHRDVLEGESLFCNVNLITRWIQRLGYGSCSKPAIHKHQTLKALQHIVEKVDEQLAEKEQSLPANAASLPPDQQRRRTQLLSIVAILRELQPLLSRQASALC